MRRVALLLVVLGCVPPLAASAPPKATVSTRGHVTYFRLSGADAERVAAICAARGPAACGDLITRGDGPQFAADCNRSGAVLARQLRAAAGAARRREPGWNVVMRTETGGYPYICAFTAAATAAADLCAVRRISQPELDAMPLFERIFALVRHGFCVGTGWAPDLPDGS